MMKATTSRGYVWKEGVLTLDLRIKPRASKTRWQKVQNGKINLQIAAPPVDNRANEKCVEFLAKAFKTAKANITILQGHTSRSKVIQIQNLTPEQWEFIITQIPE
ncbi:DUF167 domain-containing protein [Deltaproteobacteria bacterium TL4]